MIIKGIGGTEIHGNEDKIPDNLQVDPQSDIFEEPSWFGEKKKETIMNNYTTYAIIWIVVTAAVIFGIYTTHSANCLWALIFPLCIDLNNKKVIEVKTKKDD